MVTTRSPKTIVKPTALGPVANTDTKLLIYGLFQKGRVLAQVSTPAENCTFMAGENCTPDDWVTNPKTPAPPGISCER